MPLHLLHHKSYHVYNAANVQRVRHDEAEAAANAQVAADLAATEASKDRLEILRARAAGELSHPPSPLSRRLTTGDEHVDNALDADDRPRKKVRTEAQRKLDHHIDRTGLTDKSGHINLFPAPPANVQKNVEAEKERKEKEAEWEAQNFHNALGRPCDELQPWYTTGGKAPPESSSRKRGGGEWGGKKEEKRKGWADPLNLVNTGVRRLREVEEAREEWRRGRERDVGGGDGVFGDDTEEEPAPQPREDSWSRGRDRVGKQERDPGDVKRVSHDHHSQKHHRRGSRSPRDYRPRKSRSRSRRPHHHHHRHHHRSNRHHSDTPDERLAKLRAEREKREAAERAKAKELLRREKEKDTPGWKPVQGGRYSKQFGKH